MTRAGLAGAAGAWIRATESQILGQPVLPPMHGVSSYQISRSVDDPSYVMIDLDFDTQANAEALLTVMRGVAQVPGKM